MKQVITAAFGWLAACAPAGADPAWQGVYEGLIGPSRIIASLSPQGARYVYLTRPNDLGLIVRDAGTELMLIETLTPNIGADDIKANPKLVSGRWRLSVQGEKLNGTWSDAKGGSQRRIMLTRVSTLTESTDAPISPAHPGPYGARWIAMGPNFVPQGTESRIGEIAYTLVRDDFYGNLLPRLTHAPAKVRIGAVNGLLENLHKTLVLRDRNCAQDLRTSTAMRDLARLKEVETPTGAKGSFSQSGIEAVYATASAMTLFETRSQYCGGAHPDNSVAAYTFDLNAPRQIGGLADGDDDLGPSGVGGALDIADKTKREKFDAFWTARFKQALATRKSIDATDDARNACNEDLTRQLDDTGAAIDKIVYPLPAGLAFRATGFPHVLSVCLTDYPGNPLVIAWDELKPYAKPGQKLLPELK